MRKRILFLFLLSTLLASFGVSQNVKKDVVQLTFNNTQWSEAFKKIEKSFDCKMLFTYDDIKTYKTSCRIRTASALEAVKTVIGNAPFTCTQHDNFISVVPERKKPSRIISISGRVTDEENQPLPGVSVTAQGASGTITDKDGKFTMKISDAIDYINLTYVGMQSLKAKVSTRFMNIVMKESAQVLKEVVVTGMQKMDKRLFTGATTSLNGDDIKMDGVPEVSRALEGRAAGVSVQNVTGTFGTAPKIQVRGATSIYGNSKPLWVVDGVIVDNVTDVNTDELSSGNAETLLSSAISGLNADDIESFQILRDGSATSIYGARAMSGVIVITTKKGKAGRSSINYTGEFTWRLKPNYRDYNIMNSQEQMSVYQEMETKGWLGLAGLYNAANTGIYGKMAKLIATGDIENTESGRNAYLREAEYRNTDWFDVLFQNDIMQNHSVSITSGTDRSQHYASVSVLTDPGWYKQSKVNRYTLNMNSTFNISKQLAINLIGNASYRKQKAPGTLSSTVDPVNGTVQRSFDINPYSFALNTSRVLDSKEYYTRSYAPFNILHELDNNYIELSNYDFKLQGQLTWKPIQGLEFNVLGAAKSTISSAEHNIKDDSNQATAYRTMPSTVIRDSNTLLYTDPDNPYAVPITILPYGGIYNRTDYRMNAFDFRATAAYNKVFKDKHIMNLFAGMETNAVDRRRTWFRGWGLQYSLGEVANFAYEAFKKTKEEGSTYFTMANGKTRSAAFFANGTYSYEGKYTINGTIRYEGTNTLGKSRKSRWLPTWNISGAWNAHEEKFFAPLKPTFSHLTLKASYSLTADRGPESVSNSQPIISANIPWRPNAGDQESALELVNIANEDLTYEKKHEWNFTADFGFFDNRINLEASYYTRKNFDLIGNIRVQGVGGAIDKYGNVADMKSSGTEIALTTKNIKSQDFNWTTTFLYSHATNKVTNLDNVSRVIDLVTGSGFALQSYPVRSIFSIPYAGLTNQGIPYFKTGEDSFTISGINFQQSKNLEWLKYEGSANPTDYGSMDNIFNYKNLSLSVFFTYSFGNVIRLDPVFSSSYSDLSSMPKEFKNRWMVPGDENKTNVPTISSKRQNNQDPYLGIAYNSYNYSDVRIAKGDFIRLKEVSLNYSFPKKILDRFHVSKLDLKLQATNLFLLYADKKLNGQDPEFINSGGVASPMPKQFTFTLRLGI
jgi:TonB-linked SusC/RagA family outer membrane protein